MSKQSYILLLYLEDGNRKFIQIFLQLLGTKFLLSKLSPNCFLSEFHTAKFLKKLAKNSC